MPEICRFFGIVIKMFFADHAPPVGNNQNEAKNNNGCTDHKQDKTQNTLQQP
jgi:hypothetical protein